MNNKKRLIIMAADVIAVIAVIVIIGVLMGRMGRQTKEESMPDIYFGGSLYPVTVEEGSGGSVVLTLDGSATPDLTWDIENGASECISYDKTAGSEDGMTSIIVSPLVPGYARITFTRTGNLSGVDYTAAEITADLLVTQYDDGSLSVSVTEIYEDTSDAGEVSSESPFLIQGNRILLPNGGDWELTDTGESGLYDIHRGLNDDGVVYIDVYTEVPDILISLSELFEPAEENDEEVNSETGDISDIKENFGLSDEDADQILTLSKISFILKSETLEKEYTLKYRITETGAGLEIVNK